MTKRLSAVTIIAPCDPEEANMSALVKKCSGFRNRSPSSEDSGSEDVKREDDEEEELQDNMEETIRNQVQITPEDVMKLTHITSGELVLNVMAIM